MPHPQIDDFWEREPTSRFAGHVFQVSIPRERGVFDGVGCYVQVDPDGLLNLLPWRWGFGEKKPQGSFELHNQNKEIYDWLCEWELAVWRRIGPEDSEPFATKKLDEEFGIDD